MISGHTIDTLKIESWIDTTDKSFSASTIQVGFVLLPRGILITNQCPGELLNDAYCDLHINKNVA